MPTLFFTPYENNKRELEIIFDITGLETHGTTTEGWLRYSLILKRHDAELVAIRGTLHNTDAVYIEKLIEKGTRKPKEYVPIEPDFKLRVEDNDDVRLITLMANHGLATDHTYDDAGVGICIPAEKSDCADFANSLRTQRLGLLKNIRLSGFNAVDIPS